MKQIYDYKNPEPKYASAKGNKFQYELLRYRDHILENKEEGNFVPPILVEYEPEEKEATGKITKGFCSFLKTFVR